MKNWESHLNLSLDCLDPFWHLIVSFLIFSLNTPLAFGALWYNSSFLHSLPIYFGFGISNSRFRFWLLHSLFLIADFLIFFHSIHLPISVIQQFTFVILGFVQLIRSFHSKVKYNFSLCSSTLTFLLQAMLFSLLITNFLISTRQSLGCFNRWYWYFLIKARVPLWSALFPDFSVPIMRVVCSDWFFLRFLSSMVFR